MYMIENNILYLNYYTQNDSMSAYMDVSASASQYSVFERQS